MMAMKLKEQIARETAEEQAPAAEPIKQATRGRPRSATPSLTGRPASREGKRAIVGHFSPEMHKEVNRLAFEQDRTLQAVVGEALDDFLVKHGKKPFGER